MASKFFLKLPLFITKKNCFKVILITFFFLGSLYLVTNRFQLFPSKTLPLFWIDFFFSFSPISFWVYISMFVLFLCSYFWIQSPEVLNKTLYALIAAYLISACIFIFFPIIFPRAAYSLLNTDPLTRFCFHFFRTYIDSPHNCFPSLHVASVYLCAFSFLHEKKKNILFPAFFLWATAISISTMTTKQHYFLDVIAGFFLALGLYVFFFHSQSICYFKPTKIRKK